MGVKSIISVTVAALVVIVLLVIIFGGQQAAAPQGGDTMPNNTLQLSSPVFQDGGTIPVTYTCQGSGVNPPLAISGVPGDTKSFALIVHDPDAPGGDFLHWTVWNIPASSPEISEDATLEQAVQGKNDFGETGYGAPCPPSGTHRYIFALYALDAKLDLPAGSSLRELHQAMQGHVISDVSLTGTVSAE